ncbi:hypothetical protein BKH41_02515 [Helicobacter sp. 12S02232-10]|uniref:DUF4006 family protein n=1 Tax=Helicobacter sp. 12S02232-10 TaxID=1476197 RepID=UPI000BA789DA|nr:DUF4006 family protein [Helicobacter sp. 12S02232-10]PAF49556.1 hypothetical protein BKH41_02515 [Helicobacter sp. 12S02232-10]
MNGLFGINGLLGYLIAVLLVVGAAILFSIAAINIQKTQAVSYYKIDNQDAIKMKSIGNEKHYELMQEK